MFSFMRKILPILLNTKIKTRSYFLTRKFIFNHISKGNLKNCVFCRGNLNKNWEIISNLTCKMKNNKRTYLQNNFGRSNLYFLNFFHHFNKKKLNEEAKMSRALHLYAGFLRKSQTKQIKVIYLHVNQLDPSLYFPLFVLFIRAHINFVVFGWRNMFVGRIKV